MPASRVLGHGFIQNITKANKTLPLYYATKTASWERPLDQPAAHVRIGFVNAMKKLSDDKVPSEAVQAVMTCVVPYAETVA